MALIIFDLDGTLVDSVEGLGVATNQALEELGLPTYDIEAYKNFVGNGIEMLVERALKEENMHYFDRAFPRMMEIYRTRYEEGLSVYDGIYELLDRLVAKKHTIALVTNKHQYMADVIMDRFFADYPFVDVIGRNEEHPAKPDPTTVLDIFNTYGSDKEICYMVGDTEVDLHTARNAGIKEIFVTWGFRKVHEVAHLAPETLIETPLELLNTIGNDIIAV